MDKKTISIMTPCYNEAGNLEKLYERTTSVMNSMRDYKFEWVIIDNSSTDNSREILRAIASRDERVRVIYNLRNFGPGRSSCHGLFQTSGDAAICMACDLQDPPELIPDYVAKWEQGSDVVLGKIASSEESKRAFATRGLFYKIMASFSDNPIESHVTGFGLYSRRVIELLKAEGNPVPNFRFSISNFGFDVSYIEYDQPIRNAGQSSYNFMRKLDTSIESLTQISTKPIRMITVSGAILASLSLLALLISIAGLVITSSDAAWRILCCALMGAFAGLLALAIGVVGEYVILCLMYIKQEPLVYEKARINFTSNIEDSWAGPKVD